MQPRYFLPGRAEAPDAVAPTVGGFLVNLLTGVLLLWVVPAFLPEQTPLFVRVWLGLLGFGFLLLFEVMDGWARQYPAAVDRTLRGVTRAIHFIRTNRAETLTALSQFIDVTDPRGLDEAYDEVIMPLIPAEPFASPEATRTILDFLARENPQLRGVEQAKIIDNRWVQQLVDSGFIAQLYGR